VHDLAMPRSLLHAGHLPGPATASTTNWRPTPQRWRSRLASLSGCHPIGRHDSAASTGNADCAPAHVLMVPRCPACSPVPTCGRFAWCSSRGEPWVSRAIHWPGAPGWSGQPRRGRMTRTAWSRPAWSRRPRSLGWPC